MQLNAEEAVEFSTKRWPHLNWNEKALEDFKDGYLSKNVGLDPRDILIDQEQVDGEIEKYLSIRKKKGTNLDFFKLGMEVFKAGTGVSK